MGIQTSNDSMHQYIFFDINISYDIIASKNYRLFNISQYSKIFDIFAIFDTDYSLHHITEKKITNAVT